jgi:hypothetical protein
VALIGVLSGLVWMLSPWSLPFGAVAWAGLAVVGLAARRAGQWTDTELALLLAAGIGGWLAIGAIHLTEVRELVVAAWACFGLGWLAVGRALVRARPRSIGALLVADGS